VHYVHAGVLPVSTHDIDLILNTQYSGSDFKYKACFNRPYLQRMRQFLELILVKQPENFCTAVD